MYIMLLLIVLVYSISCSGKYAEDKCSGHKGQFSLTIYIILSNFAFSVLLFHFHNIVPKSWIFFKISINIIYYLLVNFIPIQKKHGINIFLYDVPKQNLHLKNFKDSVQVGGSIVTF